MPEETTKNQRIRIAETRFSGKDLLSTVEDVTGKQWIGVHRNTDGLVEESIQAKPEGNMRGFYLGQILKLGFDGKGSCYFGEGMMQGVDAVKRLALREIIEKSLVSN